MHRRAGLVAIRTLHRRAGLLRISTYRLWRSETGTFTLRFAPSSRVSERVERARGEGLVVAQAVQIEFEGPDVPVIAIALEDAGGEQLLQQTTHRAFF